jgi:hypothetical protein
MTKEHLVNHLSNLQRYEIKPHEFERYRGVIERKAKDGEWVSWNDIYNLLMLVDEDRKIASF